MLGMVLATPGSMASMLLCCKPWVDPKLCTGRLFWWISQCAVKKVAQSHLMNCTGLMGDRQWQHAVSSQQRRKGSCIALIDCQAMTFHAHDMAPVLQEYTSCPAG